MGDLVRAGAGEPVPIAVELEGEGAAGDVAGAAERVAPVGGRLLGY